MDFQPLQNFYIKNKRRVEFRGEACVLDVSCFHHLLLNGGIITRHSFDMRCMLNKLKEEIVVFSVFI